MGDDHGGCVGLDPEGVALDLFDRVSQCRPVYQFDAVADGKGDCRCAELPAAHDHPVIAVVRRHDTRMLTHDRYTNLVRAPVPALYERARAGTHQGKIDSFIRPGASTSNRS